MHETTELTEAICRLADRLRTAPQSRLQRGAAAEGLALARELASRAQRLEDPGTVPREVPDAGIFAVADQLLATGADFAEAWLGAAASTHRDGMEAASQEELREELAQAVELVKEAKRRVGL
ncbi:hypothetical protein [Streptomyces sp. CC210A]|uniref:hypothetical protein n=1 Tax=Streptomyces sp. CC210A TaxID=2898184 RepID=UPI001F1FE51E|nr:hypothetical protein [Streptomyces sp. CC210A]